MECALAAEEYESFTDVMSLNKEDREWIRNAIVGTAVKQPSITPQVGTQSGAWGLSRAAKLCAVVVPVLGFAFWCARLGSDVGHLQGDVARIDGRLDSIQSSILTLRAAQSPQEVFQEIGTFQPKQLSNALPALQKIAEQPVATVAPQPVTLREVAANLHLVSETSPDYWPAVLSFIQFASSSMASAQVPSPGEPTTKFINVHGFGINIGTVRHEVVLLDDVDLSNATFENCRMVFTDRPVHMRNVIFINCVFEFPHTSEPNQALRLATRLLLGSGIQNVTISSV